MLRVEQYGGMVLVTHGADKDAIDRALKRLDPLLFLDPEIDPRTGVVFWTVKYSRGDQYPLLITDWRDTTGAPRELSWAIVDDLKRREGLAWVVADQVARENRRLQERRQAEAMQGYEEIAADMLPRVLRPRRTVQPRGQSLRRMRDKQRARGENV